MMLKRTIRYVSYFLALFSTSAVVGACGDDDDDLCYKCTYGGDSETLCFSDYKDDYTKAEFNEIIDYIEDYIGANCKKK